MGVKSFFWLLLFFAVSSCNTANSVTVTPTRLQPTATWTLTPSLTLTSTNTVEPTTTPTPSPQPTSSLVLFRTPQIDVSQYKDIWKRYINEEHGVSFEYPVIYDVEPYSDCGVKAEDKKIRVGFESSLLIHRINMSLDTYIDRMVIGHMASSQKFSPKIEKDINGVRAIELTYSVTNRGVCPVTFIERDSILFTFEYLKGPGCDIPDVGIQELDVYERMISSFQFER